MNQKLNRMKQILVALVLIAAVEGFSSCEKYSYTPPAVDPNAAWSLKTDIQPIFNANCIACHGGTQSPDLRDGKSFTILSKGFVTAPAESSRLYLKMISGGHESRSTAADKLKVLYWITQGAQNN
jgi:mono/diheme cytochrome c family protein